MGHRSGLVIGVSINVKTMILQVFHLKLKIQGQIENLFDDIQYAIFLSSSNDEPSSCP